MMNPRFNSRYLAYLVIAAFQLVGCQPAPAASFTLPTATTQAQTTGIAPATAQPGGAGALTVKLVDTTFNPAQLTVKAGTTVTWTNNSTMNHTVTADDGSFSSNTLAPGDQFQVTFTKTGTFRYYCKFHGGPGGQGMSGTITVQ